MADIFRVCIVGRYYDIPTDEISNATLQSLQDLIDESNSINPRDLLRTFLEYSEINNFLKNEIIKANQKLKNIESQTQEILQESTQEINPNQQPITQEETIQTQSNKSETAEIPNNQESLTATLLAQTISNQIQSN